MVNHNNGDKLFLKTIWIDLDNSPHVLFFKPIIEKLIDYKYKVIITTRDCFQVCELADLFNMHYRKVGKHYGKIKIIKLVGLFIRSMQLLHEVLRKKPDIVLSHGSRSQLFLSYIFKIPSILFLDYEYARFPFFLRPNWVIAPEIIPKESIFLDNKNIYKYPGIKEDVYIPDFKPDSKIMSDLGISHDEIIVTVRPPAVQAHYHNPKSEILFKATIEYIGSFPKTRIIILPRNLNDVVKYKKNWATLFNNQKIIIPKHAVNGLNLIWHSDLVISGGGTMNREAAALGIPVFSIFKGQIGAVDKYLSENNRLVIIEDVPSIKSKIIINKKAHIVKQKINNTALKNILDIIMSKVDSV